MARQHPAPSCRFKIAIAGVSGIAFDVTFRSEADASQFEQAFT
jgi:hypothetical protein